MLSVLPSIENKQFILEIEQHWNNCDRYELESAINRGKLLRLVREHTASNPDGSYFKDWLKNHEISKSHAYRLIQLAEVADGLIENELLEQDEFSEIINKFSQRSFLTFSEYEPDIQEWIIQLAKTSEKMGGKQVKGARDSWIASTSDLLPQEIKDKATEGSAPKDKIAQLADTLEMLPETHQLEIFKSLESAPNIENIEATLGDAKNIAKYLDKVNLIQSIADSDVDIESVISESLRLGNLADVAKLAACAEKVQNLAVKLAIAYNKLQTISDQIYNNSGESTPQIRSLLTAIKPLSGEVIKVKATEKEYIQLSLDFQSC